ncbi:FAD-binding protein [Paenibacillus sp. MWE-103]|uniref:FAD-binding protein n=1 Tax=Paenibacillus artemisiicola TaxID=1172618 RepID=A0ABS3W370_9BACL|nr:FAD-binding protein [Paenibacillus artemisiicola]MBO7742748.1 FAD-binding protein [Paenibacillus artemisiicola]
MEQHRNWAGNLAYAASNVQYPESVAQLQELTAGGSTVKALGTRHSFNDIADTEGTHISTQKLNRVVLLDRERRRVTVEGGIRYGDLCGYLHDNGFALHNLASLPHITVAGAVATATHGSGVRNGNLATAVAGLELVRADGELVSFSRDDETGDFHGAVVGLGALGVVAKLTLDLVPAFDVAQTVYENLPLAALETGFDDVMSSAYSVSLFTDWKQVGFNQAWVKRKAGESADGPSAAERAGATPAASPLHPVPGFSAENCSAQLGVPGPWHDRLPHFRMAFTPSAGEELQSEFFVPRTQAFEALSAVAELRESIAPLLYVTEVRSVAADRLWLSPSYGQDAVGIHFTWKPDWEAVRRLLPVIEERLAPFGARPHWGKLFTMAPERLRPLYAQLPEFRRLAAACDPEGKFRNAFLQKFIAESGS